MWQKDSSYNEDAAPKLLPELRARSALLYGFHLLLAMLYPDTWMGKDVKTVTIPVKELSSHGEIVVFWYSIQ